jgi:hypothetical protein
MSSNDLFLSCLGIFNDGLELSLKSGGVGVGHHVITDGSRPMVVTRGVGGASRGWRLGR